MQNPYGVWVENVLKHEAVLCPLGNSPGSPDSDNHRIYEVLYLNRIPVVHVKSSYDKLHHQFPVILIENLEDVGDESFMRQQIDKVKNKNIVRRKIPLGSYIVPDWTEVHAISNDAFWLTKFTNQLFNF